MATCFMTRERMNIFFSIWNTEMAELPVKVYANRMEFNDDGTIKTLIPDMRGVGYLAAS